MDMTARLELPYIMAAQAQKHVTHNEAIRTLDALVQPAVLYRTVTLPPTAPTDGDGYIVATGSSGDWSGHDLELAVWQDEHWFFYVPQPGWMCWVISEEKLLAWSGQDWIEAAASGNGAASVNPAPLIGVNTTADATNRLAVSAPNSLFSHEGDSHRVKVNKATATDTASVLFQDDFSGRAEIGLAGDDDFHLKVSADGSTWKEAMVVDASSGVVSFPFTSLSGSSAQGENLLINGDFAINQRAFIGGTLANGAYGFDRWKAAASATEISLAGGSVTLTSGTIAQIIEAPGLAGQDITLSVEDLSGGDLSVDIEGQTGVITAGTGRKSVTLTLANTATGDITLKLSGTAVTFQKVKLERGSTVTPWVNPRPGAEIELCQRYFQAIALDSYQDVVAGRGESGSEARMLFFFRTIMRANPAFSLGGDSTTYRLYSGGTPLTVTSILGFKQQPGSIILRVLVASGVSTNNPAMLRKWAGNGLMFFDAEL